MITKHHLICLWKLELFYSISYYQAKKKRKIKWVSSYTLKGQQKDLHFICMTKLHQLNLHILVQDSICLPFPVPDRLSVSFRLMRGHLVLNHNEPTLNHNKSIATSSDVVQLFYITGFV